MTARQYRAASRRLCRRHDQLILCQVDQLHCRGGVRAGFLRLCQHVNNAFIFEDGFGVDEIIGFQLTGGDAIDWTQVS
ncbi:MAG: hypothetical protein AAGK71_04890 [Pseudomonadota bacterium]